MKFVNLLRLVRVFGFTGITAFVGLMAQQGVGAPWMSVGTVPPSNSNHASAESQSVGTSETNASDFLVESAVFRENSQGVTAAAEAKIDQSTELSPELKTQLKRSLRELPFHRLVDIRVSFLSGIPDLVGLCAEGHPTNRVSVEACASWLLFISSVSLAVKYRWDLVLRQTKRGSIHQLSLGPSVGIRRLNDCFDSCTAGMGADVGLSLQYVFWFINHFGLNAQLDLGGSFWRWNASDENGDEAIYRAIPVVKISVGVSF